jgi:beta-phosphoglucomutase-like phosphatase (HAD superfamily)
MASSVAAAHATLAALAFASSARATAAPRAPRRGGCGAPGGLADDRARANALRAGRPGSGSRRGALSSVVAPPRALGPSAMSGNGGDTNIVIPDTFTPPPPRELRDAPKPFFPPVGVADDPSVANPLQRLKRLSTEWFGCVFELEGVLIEAREAEHRASWMKLASERGEPPVPEMVLKFASTSKPEDFIQRQLRWTRDPMETRRIAQRRAEIYREILEGPGASSVGPSLLPGVRPFLETLAGASVPMAATCGTMSFSELRATLETLDILRFFENPDSPLGEPNCVSSEDVSDWLPDPLPVERACQLMGRPPKRCVVFGDNSTVVEACVEVGAKSVLLLGRQPRYELQGADAVVGKLTDLSIANLKNLFADEVSEAAEPEREAEIFPQNVGRGAETATYEPEPETAGDDVGGREPPNYKSRRRRRDV